MLAFLGGAFLVSALVAGSTYFLADRYLYNQRIESATEQTFSNIRFAVRYLARTPEAQVALSELAGLMEARGTFDVLVIQGEQWFSSSVAITPDTVPRDLALEVTRDRVAYEFRGSQPQLVFGSPIPGSELIAYFFYPVEEVAEALTLLGQTLLALGLGAVMLAAVVGSRVSRRVVHPVRRASEAARRVAEGLLETRLPVRERDEIGTLAHSFNEMAAALESRISHERRFVGDVSHELRTPLTTLRASTDYLLERSEDLPPGLHRAAELLSADLEYLQRLVDDLLDISRLEAGRVEMSMERLNVADLVREVVARRTRTGHHHVRLTVEGDPDTLTTLADKQRLERVVVNLLDNALTHGTGEEVSVRVGTDNGDIRLAVEDHGPGIPLRDQHRIFERFFKADPARPRTDGRGSGLGLAIARENATLHGGDIEVLSRPGEGSTFVFRLPRRDEEHPE
jgi:two-component system, OmpR family, sensor histidine kinase MtrB